MLGRGSLHGCGAIPGPRSLGLRWETPRVSLLRGSLASMLGGGEWRRQSSHRYRVRQRTLPLLVACLSIQEAPGASPGITPGIGSTR